MRAGLVLSLHDYWTASIEHKVFLDKSNISALLSIATISGAQAQHSIATPLYTQE